MGEEELVEKYAYLVGRIASSRLRRLPRVIDYKDLIQAGMIGLIEAHRNHDPNKGASFETYAGIRIRGAMLDEMRRFDYLPRQSGHAPRPLSYEQVLLYHPEKLPDATEHETPEAIVIRDQLLGRQQEILNRLSGRDQIVARRCLINEEKGRTVARELGVTESRVCQIKAKLIEKIRLRMLPAKFAPN